MDKDMIPCTLCDGMVIMVQNKINVENNILTRSRVGYCEKCNVRHDWEEKYSFIEQNIIKVWNN